MDLVVDFALLALLAVTAVAIVRVRSLFAAVMLAGIYSFLTAGLFVVMDAVDVAFTESAVGAGVSTILMLATMTFVGHREKKPVRSFWVPLAVVTVTGLVLSYGMLDMPPYGDPGNPVHHHVAPRFLLDSPDEIGVPNVVTSVLASYRGYDTMGETAVVFTALVGVLLLLTGRPEQGATVERTGAAADAGPDPAAGLGGAQQERLDATSGTAGPGGRAEERPDNRSGTAGRTGGAQQERPDNKSGTAGRSGGAQQKRPDNRSGTAGRTGGAE